jgi:heterodisulfide reductase subunit B2
MKYAYYPGCSLESSAKEYDLSLRAVYQQLGIELVEIEDWNCCGATPGGSTDKVTATALIARNLAWAEERGLEILAPCSACYKNLRKATLALQEDRELRAKVNDRLEGRRIQRGPAVKGPVEVLVVDLGLDKLAVSKALTGLKVLPYYGCPMTRPKGGYEDTERPEALDRIITALGAQPVDCPSKTKCCGGGIVMSREDVALDLTGKLLRKATEAEADCMITMCPLCHMLLDAYQPKAAKHLRLKLDMPVLYFTQLMGLAMGIDGEQLGLKRHVVSPFPMLERRGIVT